MGSNGDRRRGGGHLPPGHEPGRQSRRVARGTPWALALCTLGAAALVIGAVVLLLTARHAKSPTGARVGAVVLFVFGIGLTALAMWAYRRWRHHEPRYLELRVEPIELRRGDTITATLVIADAGKLGEELDLGLLCTEYYDQEKVAYNQNGEYKQRVTSSADTHAAWQKANRDQTQQSVRFTVPADATFSYEGGTVSWAWHVRALDRHPHRPDAYRDIPIWVSP